MWDNGAEGNYWNNYNGTDTNGDGIGDTPYAIDANNMDNYPLVAPFIVSPSPKPQLDHFPTLFVALSIAAAVVVAAGLLVYFRRRR